MILNVTGPLGRREPTDFKHVERYPLSAAPPPPVKAVEVQLHLPRYRGWYHQHDEGCTGFSGSWCQSIYWDAHSEVHPVPKFDPEWLYHQAQLHDEFPDTPPAGGSSVRAAFDVLRTQGHCLVDAKGHTQPPDLLYGVKANRWALTVDELRACIGSLTPFVLGIPWMTKFDRPEKLGNDWWIARKGDKLGVERGGHAICGAAASDKRQAFALIQSWGTRYPWPAWIAYDVVQQLLDNGAEACVPTER